MRKHKFSVIISITSLVLSFGCASLILLYVLQENSFDRFYPDHDRVFRVAKTFTNDSGELVPDALTPGALAPALKDEFPQLESVTRIEISSGRALFTVDDKSFYEDRFFGADSSFFEVFPQTFIEGNPMNTLKDDKTIVITQSLKEKFFGEEPAMGQFIKIDQLHGERMVTGVVKDVPTNAHFHFDALFKINTMPYEGYSIDQEWNGYNWYTYVKILANQNSDVLKEQIQKLVNKNSPDLKADYFLQPLTDIHLLSQLKSELEINGSYTFIKILTVSGIFILLVGLINFANLSIVRAIYRAKEAGICKINGATGSTLFINFSVESLLMIFFAAMLTVILVYQTLPMVNNLFGIHLTFDVLQNYSVVIGFLLLLILCVATAMLPAIYYSRFNPKYVLKGIFHQGDRLLTVKKSLIVFQFMVTAILLVSIIVIHRQMQFVKNRSLGFDRDQLLVLSGVEGGSESKNSFLQLPEVAKASFTSSVPGEKNMFFMAAAKGSSKSTIIDYSFVDFDYFDVMGMKIIEGRGFSLEFPSDLKSFPLIINETAVKVLGLGNKAVGSEITPNPKDTNPIYFKVIGVVKDFNFTSFHEPIKPFMFTFGAANSNLVLKISSKDYQEVLSKLENHWKTLFKTKPFDFRFVDEVFHSGYKREEQFQSFLSWLTGITIFIACSGLLAIATFLIARQKKEVGIRKVMGASTRSILMKICSRYVQLTLFSVTIAVPASLYVMNEWLNNFAYKISITGLEFVLAGAALVFLTILTIGYQVAKIAATSPSETLRSE